MMNTRVLDIIKNPEIIQIDDLKLLETEIAKFPYAQSLRAIYLLGIHRFNSDNFQKELAKTAAYTTDKRILYNFINQEKEQENLKEEEIKSVKIQQESIKQDSLVFSGEGKAPNTNIWEISTTEVEETKFHCPKTEEKEEKDAVIYEKPIDFYLKDLQNIESPKNIEPIVAEKKSIMDFYTPQSYKEENQLEERSVPSPISFYEKQIKTSSETPTEENEAESSEGIWWKPIQQKYEERTTQPEIQEEPVEEVINISFLETDLAENTREEPVGIEEKSNVSVFINTWKSWLKIDRSEIVTPSEQDKKAAIIDKFIENNPKISPIKEDVDFIVKEKSNDISHLMTETLAQLYVEQKLYTKAIQAYKILQEKHPEKTEEFEERIEEIKKSRNIK